MKQETLAEELEISQQSVSHIEQSETIQEDLLKRVAKALGVSKEAIEKFSEENMLNFINNFNDNSVTTGHLITTIALLTRWINWWKPTKKTKNSTNV